jgi:hypothetical protein
MVRISSDTRFNAAVTRDRATYIWGEGAQGEMCIVGLERVQTPTVVEGRVGRGPPSRLYCAVVNTGLSYLKNETPKLTTRPPFATHFLRFLACLTPISSLPCLCPPVSAPGPPFVPVYCKGAFKEACKHGTSPHRVNDQISNSPSQAFFSRPLHLAPSLSPPSVRGSPLFLQVPPRR